MNQELKTKELDLYYKYKSGDMEAKNQLVKSLNPIISQQASKYYNSGIPPIAIRLEGKRLADHAIDTYDPSKAQLNTHVFNNLQKLSRFVTTYQNVGYIPEPRALMIGRYINIKDNLEAELGREPTTAELADALKVSVAEIDRLQLEMRKELSMQLITQDDEGGRSGFYEYSNQPTLVDPKRTQAIDIIYFDSDNTDRKILEMTGLYGNFQKRTDRDMLLALNLSPIELKTRKQNIAKKIKELL